MLGSRPEAQGKANIHFPMGTTVNSTPWTCVALLVRIEFVRLNGPITFAPECIYHFSIHTIKTIT